MLSIKWIRENKTKFDEILQKRSIEPISDRIIQLDEERRGITTLIQHLKHTKNEKSKSLGSIADKTSKTFITAKQEVDSINNQLNELTNNLDKNNELNDLLNTLPNILEDDVPYGTDESMNKLVRSSDNKPKTLPRTKQHFELGTELRLMDFKQTAIMSGARFGTLLGDLAKLERALVNFMLDTHTTEFDFLEVSPPALVRDSAMFNAGQLPKFAHESFYTTNGYRLIPTGEVPLVNMVADKIIAREELPLRYVAYTPCFRSEAGSAGRDTRGLIRLHQFSKVELVSITTPDESKDEHEYITDAAETILKKLQLPYRVMLLCTSDTGFTAKKTYDLEVWLPGQKKYREIASCSNCGDFQARRLKARYKEFGCNENTFVHTLNASGLAVGRTIVAILENYQNEDGTIAVPDVLINYMGGIQKISPYKE